MLSSYIPFSNSVAEAPPTVRYKDVMESEEGLANWLAQVVSYVSFPILSDKLLNFHKRQKGFAFVEKVPINPDATKSLLERIAFIRQTHYGW